MRGGVAEGHRRALEPERGDDAVMGDFAEAEDHREARHGGDGVDQERPAGPDFGGRRLVFRRHAAHGVGDRDVDQVQAVVRPRRIGAGREAEIDQCPVEQVAGIVAGEGPSGAVGAAQARRQPDDEKPGVERPEGRHRRVVPVGLRRPPLPAKRHQPRAERAVAVRFAPGHRIVAPVRVSLRRRRPRIRPRIARRRPAGPVRAVAAVRTDRVRASA